MNTQEILIKRTESLISNLSDSMGIKIDIKVTAHEFVERSYTYEDSKQQLTSIEIKDDIPVRLVKLDLLAATGFIASLVGGIVGVCNPIILGSVIVSSVLSLHSLIDEASHAECGLFWIIYELDNHSGTRKNIRKKFHKLSKGIEGLEKNDFNSALNGLINLNLVKQIGDQLTISEKLVFVWFRE